MKNDFYFTLQILFDLEIFEFLMGTFGQVEKGLDKKGNVNFKIYDARNWITNNYITHIA